MASKTTLLVERQQVVLKNSHCFYTMAGYHSGEHAVKGSEIQHMSTQIRDMDM